MGRCVNAEMRGLLNGLNGKNGSLDGKKADPMLS